MTGYITLSEENRRQLLLDIDDAYLHERRGAWNRARDRIERDQPAEWCECAEPDIALSDEGDEALMCTDCGKPAREAKEHKNG